MPGAVNPMQQRCHTTLRLTEALWGLSIKTMMVKTPGAVSPTFHVGRLIREHRTRRHLTQIELARQVGISQSDLSRMEKGEYRVPLDVLFRILQAFELTLGEFFGELNHSRLTPEEQKLLNSFRALSADGQREVLDFVEFLKQREGR